LKSIKTSFVEYVVLLNMSLKWCEYVVKMVRVSVGVTLRLREEEDIKDPLT